MTKGGDEGIKHAQHKEHLDRRKIGHTLAVQIVANHLARTDEQMPYGTGQAPAAHTPHIERVGQSTFHREAAGLGTLSAFGTVMAFILCMAVQTSHRS